MPRTSLDIDAEFFRLIEAYRERFGEAPPVYVNSTDAQREQEIAAMKAALTTGEPWHNQIFDGLPEGVQL